MRVTITYLVLIALFVGCKKEKEYVYDVNNVTIEQPGAEKPNTKQVIEFVSIAYSDIFAKTISQDEMQDLALAYASFGDSKLIEDLIIRNFLNQTPNDIPTQAEMDADVSSFVTDTYKKLLNRKPSEFELWYLKDVIEDDATITPELVYYSILTSNEYRQY